MHKTTRMAWSAWFVFVLIAIAIATTVADCRGARCAPPSSELVGLRGAKGAQGEMGETGDTGPQGEAGVTGPAGPPGASGGDTGATGPPGPVGPQGARGDLGPDGATGVQGPTGPLGPNGPRGAQGATGPDGLAGSPGPTGVAGAAGTTGAQGSNGTAGAPGVQGPTGAAGSPGPTGVHGPTGPDGATGAQGATGPVGASGPPGPAGATGATGSCGTFVEVPDLTCASGLAIRITCDEVVSQTCLPTATVSLSSISMLPIAPGTSGIDSVWTGAASGGGSYRPAVFGFGKVSEYAVATANTNGLTQLNGDAVSTTSTTLPYAWSLPLNTTLRALDIEFILNSYSLVVMTSARVRVAIYYTNDTNAPVFFVPTSFLHDFVLSLAPTGASSVFVSPWQYFHARVTGSQTFSAGTRLLAVAAAMPPVGLHVNASQSFTFHGGLSVGLAYQAHGPLF